MGTLGVDWYGKFTVQRVVCDKKQEKTQAEQDEEGEPGSDIDPFGTIGRIEGNGGL